MTNILYDRLKPYNNLPLLPPPVDQMETIEILKAVNKATKALLYLRIAAKKIPDDKIIINTLPIRESKASSEIENIFTTDDELYKAMAVETEKMSKPTKEVLKYRAALWKGISHITTLKKFSIEMFIEIYREIKQATDGIRSDLSQTVIKKESSIGTAKDVVYTPPRGQKLIIQKLENLIEFLNDDEKYDYDPLIKLAVAHYQFEAIHPFSDGNGRTGRIINLLMIVEKNYLKQPILYLSSYIIKNSDEYYALLGRVTTQRNWQPWILFMLTGIEQTAIYTTEKINKIYKLLKDITALVQTRYPGFPKEIITRIFEHPYIPANKAVSPTIKSLNTAKKYLDELVSINILITEQVSKKIVYKNIELVNILSE